jgi:hypothetical protein
MVFHIKPVADIEAFAINRQRLAVERVQDHQWNQFFRKLIRPVVIGAVGGQHRQFVGMMIGAHQMIRSRLGS